MKSRTLIIIAYLSFLFPSCNTRENTFWGIYERSPSLFTVDTLYILNERVPDSKIVGRELYRYKQKIFNKENNEMLLENINVYWVKDGSIVFENFFWESNTSSDTIKVRYKSLKENCYQFSTRLEGKNLIVDKEISFKRTSN